MVPLGSKASERLWVSLQFISSPYYRAVSVALSVSLSTGQLLLASVVTCHTSAAKKCDNFISGHLALLVESYVAYRLV